MNKLLCFILLFVHSYGYDFYKNCNFKRIHINEPKIFENMDKNDIIALSRKYNIKYEKRNIWNVKEDIYQLYMKNKKVYIIDIDNTICETPKSEYINSIPNYGIINSFNQLFEDGHEIHYWTARGSVSNKNWTDFTYRQMKIWGVKYNTLNIGKIHYDYWIDDKAIDIKDWYDDINNGES